MDGGLAASNRTSAPVSGRNILILRFDASILLKVGAVG